ncbi:hypothetical protein MTR_8g094555 [Medicago truncatula]|uniref:Uncharacterized protein n=1 Tax=Medicago truncatula TaxID=3880 RepID=A0A072TUU5_MEDTR|nr:hypothetical protein MTR_8g094555 [Medicago truncatula]
MVSTSCSTIRVESRAGNEPNQLENSSILDSIIGSLDLVHEPNELNLNLVWFDSFDS